jgi:hypothetical protein
MAVIGIESKRFEPFRPKTDDRMLAALLPRNFSHHMPTGPQSERQD